jgi:hypothetical protein
MPYAPPANGPLVVVRGGGAWCSGWHRVDLLEVDTVCAGTCEDQAGWLGHCSVLNGVYA